MSPTSAHGRRGSCGRQRMSIGMLRISTVSVFLTFCVYADDVTSAQSNAVDYTRQVQPILQQHCYGCHGPDHVRAGLRLSSREDAMRGGDSAAPAIVPGKSDASPLIQRVTSDKPDFRMPKDADPLTPGDIAVLRAWIDQGAAWGSGASEMGHAPGDQARWCYRAPKQLPLPHVQQQGWVRNPIDAFVLVHIEKQGLHPSPEAGKHTLIRRLSLDLIGLPPSPEEVDAFVHDESPDAYERVVDRLLASPHYGERQAIPWLDAARYADTNGFEKDRARTIWPY